MAIIFSDINGNYGTDGDSELLVNLRAIEMSLENIMGTTKGERFFLPEFGSDLLRIIHQPISESTAQDLLDILARSIRIWEPRVDVILSRSQIIPDYDRNLYQIHVGYRIRDLGLEGTLRRDLLLNTG